MTAPAEPNATSIEALFRPATRFRDAHGNLRGRLPESWTEVELLPGLTVENVLATGVTWDDFLSFVRGKLVWMTPDVYVSFRRTYEDPLAVLSLGVFHGTSMFVHVRSGTATTSASATCDFMVRLLAASEHHDVSISGRNSTVAPPLSGAALSLFFQESRDSFGKSHSMTWP
jgi:hypothetical protein